MKNLYITSTGRVAIDNQTNEVGPLDSDREGIRCVYLINEPMHVYYSCGETTMELDVEPNDILVCFYESTFPVPIVVAKSEAWANNIKTYREKEEEKKLEWAQKQACKESTDCCTQK